MIHTDQLGFVPFVLARLSGVSVHAPQSFVLQRTEFLQVPNKDLCCSHWANGMGTTGPNSNRKEIKDADNSVLDRLKGIGCCRA
jgi:hypothetical protein